MNLENSHSAFAKPRLFIPLSSHLPTIESSGRLPMIDPTGRSTYAQGIVKLSESVFATVSRIDRLCSVLTQQLISPSHVSQQLNSIAASISTTALTCQTELDILGKTHNQKTSRAALLENVEAKTSAEEYATYDDYFGFVRVPDLIETLYLTQIINTAGMLFNDLSEVTIGVDELVAILSALSSMLRWNDSSQFRSQNPASQASMHVQVEAADHPGPSQASVERAEWRWILGHHLFNLCTVFCTDALDRAINSIESKKFTSTSHFVLKSAQFLRATTAAMWYAGNFPAAIYISHIRPSMALRSGKQVGFSGTQNLDYYRLRCAMDKLRSTLTNHLGHASAWPSGVRASIGELCEIELQDVEQHILIAASKVGTTPSLLQEAVQERLPSGIRTQSAVDMLREMAQYRRELVRELLQD